MEPQIPNFKRNNDEADEIVRLLLVLAANAAMTIGVITPYNDQRDLIATRLAQAGLGDRVEVGTVDRFQGSERDAILFSPVVHPSWPAARRGFADDSQLTNVAVTRAAEIFLVAGDPEAFPSVETPLGQLRAYVAELWLREQNETRESTEDPH